MKTPASATSYPFLAGGGEMGQLTRQYDWSTTSLGTPDTWPPSLRTAVSIVLHSALPMVLCWGNERICFYNDTYRLSLGTNGGHPAVGKPARALWGALWDSIGTLLEQVMTTGEPVRSDDQLIPVDRNGQVDDAYWTFSYSPAFDDAGQISGVLITGIETTQAVLGRHRTAEIQQVLTLLDQSSVALAIIQEPDLTFRMANAFYGELVGRKPEAIVGKPLLEVLPELEGQGFDQLLRNVLATGVPYLASETAVSLNRNGQLETVYINFSYQPQREANGQISGILIVATDVTPQVVNRQATRVVESNVRFRTLVEQAPVAMLVVKGEELLIETVNQAMLVLLSRESDILGKPLEAVMPELVGQYLPKQCRQVLRTGVPYYGWGNKGIVQRNGQLEKGYYNVAYTPVSEGGTITGVMQVVTEVTEQVLARQKAEESEARFRSLVESAPFPIAVYEGPDMRVQLVNQAAIATWGKGNDVIGRLLAEVLPETVNQPAFAELLRAYATGESLYTTNQRVDVVVDGQLKPYYMNYSFTPLYDANGKVYGVLNTSADVTDLALAKQQVEEAEATLRGAIEMAELGTWRIDLKTRTLDYSERLRGWFGIGIDEIITPERAYRPVRVEDRPRVQAAITQAIALGSDGIYDIEYALDPTEIGRERILHIQGRAYADEKGETYKLSGTARDVTEQRQQQRELERQVYERTEALTATVDELQKLTTMLEASQDWLTRIFEQAPVAIALLEGTDYRIRLANAGMYAIWQLPPGQQVLNKPVFEAFPGIAGLGLEALLDQVRQTGVSVSGNEQPAVFIRSGGPETAYINFVYAPMYDTSGNVSIVVVATDVTEQVLSRKRVVESEVQYRLLATQLEAANEVLASTNKEYLATNEELALTTGQLTESNQLLVRSNENLQRFAYIASHDLQEPLRKIQSFGDLLKARLGDKADEDLAYLDRMQSAASRMSTLIRDLLAFSRISTQREASNQVSLTSVLQTVLTDLELVIEETGAQVVAEPLPTVIGDALQLGQLFNNLLSNALKFHRTDEFGVPVSPVIHLRADRVAAHELPPRVRPVRMAQYYQRIEVSDNGIGFNEKYLDRIFEVFQRLHGRNEFIGTGVGLAICEKVVTNHGGAITASSTPGDGATFQVFFPD